MQNYEGKKETSHERNKRLIQEVLYWALGGVVLVAALWLLSHFS